MAQSERVHDADGEDDLLVFVVDDERNLREALVELVEGEGFRAAEAGDGADAVARLRDGSVAPDVVLLDLRMPRLDGHGVLAAIRDEALTTAPVVVISAFGDGASMIEAMRLGAYDYVTKPLDLDEIVAVLRRAAAQRRLGLAAARTRRDAPEPDAPAGERGEIVGTSRAIRDVFKQIGRVSASDATVLVTGESGTGKELVARAIHAHSARAGGPFVAINCGAIAEGLVESELFGHERGAFTGADRQRLGRFEAAGGGTLFLDEIGELSLAAQVKLLRALQERRIERVGGTASIPVDVRVIAATNRDLRREIEERRFREDLFYRIGVIELRLPPLRERPADVPLLADTFLERVAARGGLGPKTLSEEAVRALLDYDFPGNVRELENMIERAAVTAGVDVLSAAHLFGERPSADGGVPPAFLQMPFKEAVAALERELIRRALEQSGGNRTEAARRLGINRRLLYSKLDEHGLA